MALQPHQEKTLVLVKPDGVQRGLIGEIITRFERKGLKIVGLKIVQPSLELAKKHYSSLDEKWCEGVGANTREAYAQQGLTFKWDSDLEAGKVGRENLINYLCCGPVVAIVFEGAQAVQHVRNMVGFRDPAKADAGTIRADFSVESSLVANAADREVRNIVHASGKTEEAEVEIALWFKSEEILDYNLILEEVLYNPDWSRKLIQN